jgi:wobble nucleotide-excising tRNase
VRYQANLQRIESKRKEPSQIIELGSSADVLGAAKKLIDEANAKINAQNTLVENLKTEKQALTEQVWKFLADVEIKVDLANYKKKKADIEAGIQALDRKIDEARADKLAKEDHLKQLEKSTTSIQPTVNAINQLLAGFGFRTFSLATTSDGKYYVIRRPDGSDARATLSEGEFSFISFLYFYHLLKGSDSSAGITIDRVVVFDDPVSSLDSDILFVVGSLIKSLFEDVRQNKGTIKQIFVLTHNVYFHKEVTFNPRRNNGALNEETFWTVSKLQDVSRITRHSDNPIKTSYDLLWNEVRNPNLSSQSLQNTLRRILESYFRILGNMDSDAICEKFDGSEKVICRSLFSWVNDGSHSDHDDLYISADGGANEAYLSVFRKIFDKLGHLNHYKMMMGSFYAEPPAAAAAAKSDPASVATPDKVPLGEGTLPGEAAAAAH